MNHIILILIGFLISKTSGGQNLPLLKISSDSSYIVTEDEKPFFWLGGTAWELIHRLDREEVDKYLTDRANKGFTVIQTVILAELDGLNTPNAYGEKPLLNNDPTKLNDGIREVDKKHLITFHPIAGKKATDYLNDKWLDFDMFQSGHSRTAKEYSYVIESKKSSTQRPIINGEARYENIPDRFWEEKAYGWLDDADVRVSAYWSIIAGAAGYTYGCNDIWQMYDLHKQPIISARTDWPAALQLPGSFQMGYMRQLFETLPWQKMVLNQDLILNNNIDNESYILSAIGSNKKFIVAYTPIGNPIKMDLSKIDSKRINAYWFNPRSGKTKYIGDFGTNIPQEFKPWATGWGSDFLLILTAEDYAIDFQAGME